MLVASIPSFLLQGNSASVFVCSLSWLVPVVHHKGSSDRKDGSGCYDNINYDINHAWCTVKVKNSVGKTLWIPFDYGIGPAEQLAVSKKIYDKYLNTEEKRYKLYLSAQKGAPKYKNFTDADFN